MGTKKNQEKTLWYLQLVVLNKIFQKLFSST